MGPHTCRALSIFALLFVGKRNIPIKEMDLVGLCSWRKFLHLSIFRWDSHGSDALGAASTPAATLLNSLHNRNYLLCPDRHSNVDARESPGIRHQQGKVCG